MKTTLAIGIALGGVRVWIGLNVKPDAFEWVQAYKAMAHLFVGGLAVAAWRDQRQWQLGLFWGLCILEVVVAIWSRV